MSRVRPLGDLLQLFAGPAVWFAHFVVLYGAEALICTPPLASPRAMSWIALVATLAAIAALGAFVAMALRRPVPDPANRRHDAAFLRGTALLLAVLSAVAMVWAAVPAALLPVCAPPAG